MKRNVKTGNKSKVVAALAMLMVSVVALSSASYAWFTMSKEAIVDNIKLTAEADGGMEINLGNYDSGTDTINEVDAWSSGRITFSTTNVDGASGKGGYFFGPLKPASSFDGTELYYLDSAVGLSSTTGYLLNATEYGALDRDTLVKAVTLNTEMADIDDVDPSDAGAGYYIDIPVWIKTASADTPIFLDQLNFSSEGDATPNLIDAARLQVMSTDGSVPVDSINYPDTSYSHGTNCMSTANTTGVFGISKAWTAPAYNLSTAGVLAKKVYCGKTVKVTAVGNPLENQNILKVILRLWFEGQDSDCIINNSAHLINTHVRFTTTPAI